MSHGYAVTNSDGVKLEGDAACRDYAFFDGFTYLLQVNVSWHYGRVAVGDAYEGFLKILIC